MAHNNLGYLATPGYLPTPGYLATPGSPIIILKRGAILTGPLVISYISLSKASKYLHFLSYGHFIKSQQLKLSIENE